MMCRSLQLALLGVTAFAALGCSGSGSSSGPKGPCARKELTGCGAACSSAAPCESGLYCDDGVCNAECSATSLALDCSDGQSCSPDGHCTGGGDGTSGDAGDPNLCADVVLDATPKMPNVILIIDRSGSMDQDFGSSTRWNVLKQSLLADDGLIASLQNVVRFGVALYTSNNGGPTCPILTPATVSVALNNLEAIRDVYQPAETGDDTPTGDAIEALLKQMQGTDLIDGPNPTIFVLATDGEPDSCAIPDPQNDGEASITKGNSVAAVEHAFSLGVRTYLIAVAEKNELSQEHVQAVANAGIGMQNAPTYRVHDDEGLRRDLSSIVSGQLSCRVKLHGQVTAEDPCVGTVTLDGKELQCNDANGWKLVDDTHIDIQGTACEAVKLGKQLKAKFPCDSAIVL